MFEVLGFLFTTLESETWNGSFWPYRESLYILFGTFRKNPSFVGLRTLIEIYRCRFVKCVVEKSGGVHSM